MIEGWMVFAGAELFIGIVFLALLRDEKKRLNP